MSRLGKKPIEIPQGVVVTRSPESCLEIKGPRGSLKQLIDPAISTTLEENLLSCQRPTNQKRHKALHGLTRALIQNMITGVTIGYSVTLELVGVGYKVTMPKDQVVELHLGYAHPIYFLLPAEIKARAETPRGQSPLLHLEGIDKQLLGQVAAKIRALRKPEPYKGKGIRYLGEKIRRKAGKTAA